MKKCVWLMLGLAAATLSWAAGDREYSLAPAGDVDSAFVERVRVYMEKNAGAVVRLAPALPIEPGLSLEAIGRAAAKKLGKADPGIIVLARAASDQPQGVCLPDERFAVLNLDRLEAGADDAHRDRRTGQEAVRAMSMLLGMSPCPFPLCLLVGYEKTEDLDHMSGNFCPPCQGRFSRMAREAGIHLLEDDLPVDDGEGVPAALPAAAE